MMTTFSDPLLRILCHWKSCRAVFEVKRRLHFQSFDVLFQKMAKPNGKDFSTGISDHPPTIAEVRLASPKSMKRQIDHTCGDDTGHAAGGGFSEPGSQLHYKPRLERSLSQLPEVIIVDREVYERKKRAIFKGGIDQLQLVMDWDRTLTPQTLENGNLCASSHGIIESSSVMPMEYQEKAHALFQKYFPIEFDPKLSDKEKLASMNQWWTTAHKLLQTYGLTQQKLKVAVQDAIQSQRIILRPFVNSLFQNARKFDIPLVIFSAGLYDTIHEYLVQCDLLSPNMQIVSNRMAFDDDGRLIGFRGNLMHSLNKRWSTVSPMLDHRHGKRHNVIMAGDNVADVGMVDGYPDCDVCLKIGFVNDRVDERLDTYATQYDVIIVDDGSMLYLNNFLTALADSALPIDS